MMLAGALLMTSCLKDENDDTTQYYNNTAITQFKLSCVNRYVHTTTSAGADSVYKKTLSDPVVFTIDQAQRKIYNTDSLPSDVDLNHVLATISSLNSGTVVVNYPDKNGEDSLLYYSSTDSIDFTKLKDLRVYAQSGNSYRTYAVSINVHQAETNKMIWEQKTAADLPTDAKKALWEQKAAAAGMKQLLGYGTAEGYAFGTDGMLMVSKDNGDTWAADMLDDDAAWLPTDNIAFASWAFAANDSTDYQMLIGTNDKSDKACMVWRKIAEFGYDYDPCKWVQIPSDPRNDYYLPKLEHISLLYYNGLILAIGSDKKIYQSRDKGITWKTSKAYTLPEGFDSKDFIAFSDFEYIWIYARDTGEAWRGIKIE